MTDIRITVKNTAETGGTFLTPVYFGFHDGSFDLFNAGEAASAGLEQLAEDGVPAGLATERLAADPDSQGLFLTGARGPIQARETTDAIVTLEEGQTALTYAAMILPSNDAFIGNDDALTLIDGSGSFLGEQTIVLTGANVYDAGTEVNTELDAAFLNQTAPNTGVDENGVVALHPGFNGSVGNPVGEGDQNILGGTNAFGAFIDPVIADFTIPGTGVATIHVNTVVTRDGTETRDVIFGRGDDDIVEAGGGNDIVFGGAGWDVLNGGAGNDRLIGAAGDDILTGGLGDDIIRGGRGDDTIVFNTGDGNDRVAGFDRLGDDTFLLDVDGFASFDDVLAAATETGRGVEIDFGGGDSLLLLRTDLDDLSARDFLFADDFIGV